MVAVDFVAVGRGSCRYKTGVGPLGGGPQRPVRNARPARASPLPGLQGGRPAGARPPTPPGAAPRGPFFPSSVCHGGLRTDRALEGRAPAGGTGDDEEGALCAGLRPRAVGGVPDTLQTWNVTRERALVPTIAPSQGTLSVQGGGGGAVCNFLQLSAISPRIFLFEETQTHSEAPVQQSCSLRLLEGWLRHRNFFAIFPQFFAFFAVFPQFPAFFAFLFAISHNLRHFSPFFAHFCNAFAFFRQFFFNFSQLRWALFDRSIPPPP